MNARRHRPWCDAAQCMTTFHRSANRVVASDVDSPTVLRLHLLEFVSPTSDHRPAILIESGMPGEEPDAVIAVGLGQVAEVARTLVELADQARPGTAPALLDAARLRREIKAIHDDLDHGLDDEYRDRQLLAEHAMARLAELLTEPAEATLPPRSPFRASPPVDAELRTLHAWLRRWAERDEPTLQTLQDARDRCQFAAENVLRFGRADLADNLADVVEVLENAQRMNPDPRVDVATARDMVAHIAESAGMRVAK